VNTEDRAKYNTVMGLLNTDDGTVPGRAQKVESILRGLESNGRLAPVYEVPNTVLMRFGTACSAFRNNPTVADRADLCDQLEVIFDLHSDLKPGEIERFAEVCISNLLANELIDEAGAINLRMLINAEPEEEGSEEETNTGE